VGKGLAFGEGSLSFAGGNRHVMIAAMKGHASTPPLSSSLLKYA
jgi:hypothetical protein